ncbi:MAG: amidohydrolase family protein [Chloroflexi bacterium]|nr:amidohydrolase family protein [Chloroflexota bacterium]
MEHPLLAADLRPRSELVVPAHHVARAKYPAIDAHNHLPVERIHERGLDIEQMVREMDLLNLRSIVNLSGGTGDVLKRNLEALDQAYPGRFYTFCNVDWNGIGEPSWLEKRLEALEKDAGAGARGLKVFKELGLRVRDTRGALVMPDDPRIAPLWERASELSLPVLIHTADPVAFFRPLDRFNERWDELHRRPEWHFYGPDFPSFEHLIASLYRLIEAHPRTTFITAHVGCYPENLGFVSQMLDTYPNLYTDISARIAELGRAPYTAREWFLKYAERILFGTDNTPRIAMYQTYFRFLETADEYFDYAPDAEIPPQGRWKIYGVYLPDDVLKQVYSANAERVLGLGG